MGKSWNKKNKSWVYTHECVCTSSIRKRINGRYFITQDKFHPGIMLFSAFLEPFIYSRARASPTAMTSPTATQCVMSKQPCVSSPLTWLPLRRCEERQQRLSSGSSSVGPGSYCTRSSNWNSKSRRGKARWDATAVTTSGTVITLRAVTAGWGIKVAPSATKVTARRLRIG